MDESSQTPGKKDESEMSNGTPETIINTHGIWVPKAIGLISIHPFYDFMG